MLVLNRSLVVISSLVLPQQIREEHAGWEHTRPTSQPGICVESSHVCPITPQQVPPQDQTSAQVGGKQKLGIVYYSEME